MIFINLSDNVALKIKNAYYCYIISGIGESEATNLMQNIKLTEESRYHKHKNLLSYIKMGKEILMFPDIEIEK